ncbi:hypothetical protein BP5796_12304 [Coleophoma crateriformis]|uniref:Cytochrome P450 n=1 Tax=Coleophoma crateriformis TaxID=565419 RepID=A0A3D8QA86_9HELO|nr:hypothetical protein BP5796_12304 [Coleophoma crateriformis]
MAEIYTSGGGYTKTDLYSLFKQEGHTNLFTALDKKDHNEKKRRFTDLYSNSNILGSRVLDFIRDRAETFTSAYSEIASADIYLYLHCYTLDCVTAALFHPYRTQSIKGGSDKEMIEYFYNMFSRDVSNGGPLIHDYAWTSMRKGNHLDFTLAARLLEYPKIGLSNMVVECLDHIGAGIDTTGDTLCFLMWELSQPYNMKRMGRLSKELRTIKADGRLENLLYLSAVIQEALRLWAPGTLPLPCYIPNGGRVIDGYFLEAKVIVSCQSYTLHRFDSTVFENPDIFLPERWLEEECSTERQRLFFAFGSGARTCIGKYLALAEMRALLYSVYSQFRTRPADDMHASMKLSDQFITSRPEGMCCQLTFERLDS